MMSDFFRIKNKKFKILNKNVITNSKNSKISIDSLKIQTIFLTTSCQLIA